MHLFAPAPGAVEPDEQHHVAAQAQDIGRRLQRTGSPEWGVLSTVQALQWPGYSTSGAKSAHKMPELAPALSVIRGWGGGGCMSQHLFRRPLQ